MKFKIIPILLTIALISQNTVIFAQDTEVNLNESYDEATAAADISEPENTKTPIEGLEDCYILDDGSGFYVNIVNEKGEKLINTDFRGVEAKLGEYDTLLVYYPEGMADLSAGLLSKDLKTIVPKNFYGKITFKTVNNKVYVAAESVMGSGTDYYDLEGNKVDKPEIDIESSYSSWAEDTIKNAIWEGIVPDNLQSAYTSKITRKEFCHLAVQTYMAKTGNKIDMNISTPFTDIDDAYITTAFNLKIVAGVGKNKFAPDSNITRQEAAVMLNNLAFVLNIEKGKPKSEKFVDEGYFASWAKAEIYSVAGIKNGDTYVMAGTGNGKFSPWMNYTREQAIATMYRLFNCEVK